MQKVKIQTTKTHKAMGAALERTAHSVNIAPCIPAITDMEIEAILEQAADGVVLDDALVHDQ